jgi:hypothetical protein
MRLTPSDPDIETLVGRIDADAIDLQPEFQRGEVWSMAKKQRLIDSILRDWHVPPIHVIVEEQTNRQLVLDGQQRLAAIRDFARSLIPIDGHIEPESPDLAALHGKRYSELPPEWKNRFNQFTIRMFRITNYAPSEPGELFYRLNQPAALTAAEQRNAFFGETRKQIKTLVSRLDSFELTDSFWGFSNARMAYDDMLSRVASYLDQGSLKKKVTAASLADRFRSGAPFKIETITLLETVIELLGQGRKQMDLKPVHLNKATAQSWLLFLASASKQLDGAITAELVSHCVPEFEDFRMQVSLGLLSQRQPLWDTLIQQYEDRSTARVADTSSVQIRDMVLWAYFLTAQQSRLPSQMALSRRDVTSLLTFLNGSQSQNTIDLDHLVSSLNWGADL